MIKRLLTIIVLAFFVLMLIPVIKSVPPTSSLGKIAHKYVQDGPKELGAANLVTSVVVTYRGLDTLGEVTVLFIATAGVGFLLRKKEKTAKSKRHASEILKNGTSFLLPLIILYGVYIFIHGHLTPGGGFQGGVIIASALVLLMLSDVSIKLNSTILHWVESLSGAFYVGLGVLGLILAAGFLDNRFLPLGQFGHLFSAGAIPIIYSLIGLKVGAELVGIIQHMGRNE